MNPIFGDVTRNGDGFSTKITNYVNGYAYPATIIDPASPPQGYSAAVEVGEGGFHYLVVSGLPENTEVKVRVDTTQEGFVPGFAEITESSIKSKVDPALTDPVTRTADGFTSKITNWNAGFAYPTTITSPLSVPDGAEAVVEVGEGGFHYLVVRGFGENQEVSVTVGSTQAGYVSGSASITGTSLQAKVDPALTDPVTRTADGFTSKITNWTEGYAYPTTITSPLSVPDGAEAVVEVGEGGFHYLVVRGFGANQPVSVTVGMTKEGFAPGSFSITGTSLQAKVDPALTDPVTRTADGFTSKITNWNAGFAYPTTITSPLSVPDGAEAVVEVGEGGFHYPWWCAGSVKPGNIGHCWFHAGRLRLRFGQYHWNVVAGEGGSGVD